MTTCLQFTHYVWKKCIKFLTYEFIMAWIPVKHKQMFSTLDSTHSISNLIFVYNIVYHVLKIRFSNKDASIIPNLFAVGLEMSVQYVYLKRFRYVL